jgi:hypothetical protein
MSLQKTVEFRTAVAGLGMNGLGGVPVHHAAPFFFERPADPARAARFEATPTRRRRSVTRTLRLWTQRAAGAWAGRSSALPAAARASWGIAALVVSLATKVGASM